MFYLVSGCFKTGRGHLMRRIYAGASLFQYCVVIGLVVLGATPAYLLLSDQIKFQLTGFSNVMGETSIQAKINVTDPKDVISGNVQAGQFGGTSTNPVKYCVGNDCAIDFGKDSQIVLNNVPSNYGEIVETTGSAGTEKVLELVSQVAQQVTEKELATPEQIAKINNLISLGKDIAMLEEVIEKSYAGKETQLLEYTTKRNDLVKLYKEGVLTSTQYNTQDAQLRTEYKTVIDAVSNYSAGTKKLADGTEFSASSLWISYMLNPNSTIGINNTTGKINSASMAVKTYDYNDLLSGKVKLNGGTTMSSTSSTSVASPVGKYMQELKSLLEEENLNPAVINLTKTLSEEVYQVSQTLYEKAYLAHSLDYSSYYLYDPKHQEKMSDLLTNPPSETTKLDMKIICSSHGGTYNSSTGTCN